MLPDFRVRQRDYLLEITRAITQELDLDKVLARILNVSVEMLAGQAGLIALREKQMGWRVMVSRGIPSAFLEKLEPLLSTVPEGEEPASSELPQINRLLQRLTLAASLGLLTGVALPLIARKQVIGVLFVFRNYLGVFSANDKALLQSFADQAAIAVRNAQLYTQIRHEERRMVALLDSAPDGILILASDHSIEHLNSALVRMLGVPAEQIRGRKHDEIIRWARQKDGLGLEQAEAGGWPLTPNATLYVEGDLERPGKLPLPVGVTYAPLLSADGRLLNVIASVRDITRFREADELKSTFISVISHELKTPVALIKGYVSTLRREDASWDSEVVQDSLAVIEEEADRLTELIENLLDASRLQAGALSIHLSDMALDALALRIAERFRVQAGAHTLVVDFPADFPIILGDEDRLAQVLSNLISNAIKYAPGGGEIRISGQVRPEQVIVCVRDEGPGIAVDDIPHIFDRFYRASDATRMTKGAGLGLYLARAVVEAHGGRIWADPKPGAGARICFSLPHAEAGVDSSESNRFR
ncbi:MAG: GAF domain-containing protein [Anaerolineales bacterium]|nr:GAF domain-containing protein [Anaerolineales bacterium]